MTSPATAWVEVADLTGPQGDPGTTGDPGDNGVSITDAEINPSGDLIITLSSGGEINAGRALGLPGGGIDFESSVPTVGDLPTDDTYGTARYVVADGHLYVWEADGGGAGVDGWTDVGPIRGATGSAGTAGADGSDGADGADGVSVTGAAIDGAGHLIITLSAGGPVDAGVARGPAGADGADGADGAAGADALTPITYTGTVPAATGYQVGQIAFGSDGKMLRAV